jgi:hypothetical protein
MRVSLMIGFVAGLLALSLGALGCGGDGGDSLQARIDSCLEDAPEVNDCTTCGCTDCLEELEACDEVPGCRDIVECAVEEGCVGANCYLANERCRDVIDGHGGPFGQAASHATVVSDCTEDAGCPCGS